MRAWKATFQNFKDKSDLLLVGVLALFALYLGSNLFSPVRFDREKIEIWATDGQIQVRGLYHYRNRFPFPLTFSLGLPFPVDAAHPAPGAYSIAEITAGGADAQEIIPRNYRGDVVFRLWFAPRQEKWIRVDYVQQFLRSEGRYILLTTRQWNRPLDFGEYILHLNDNSELAASNYELRTELGEQEPSYSFQRRNFYPSEDWSFSWRTRPTLIASDRKPE